MYKNAVYLKAVYFGENKVQAKIKLEAAEMWFLLLMKRRNSLSGDIDRHDILCKQLLTFATQQKPIGVCVQGYFVLPLISSD